MELYVITEALKRGAEVYKNVGCTGKTDLIIEYNGIKESCDVKSLIDKGKGYYSWRLGDTTATPIGVHPETFEIKWHPKRIPEGLENFWSKPSTNV